LPDISKSSTASCGKSFLRVANKHTALGTAILQLNDKLAKWRKGAQFWHFGFGVLALVLACLAD
jgi:hypothetical protein